MDLSLEMFHLEKTIRKMQSDLISLNFGLDKRNEALKLLFDLEVKTYRLKDTLNKKNPINYLDQSPIDILY